MKTRLLIFVVIFGIGAAAVGWVYESRLRPEVEQAGLLIPDNIDYFLTNLNYRAMNTEGQLDFEFDSRRLEHYPRTDTSRIEIPSLQIYRDTDHWQVDAQRGEFQHRANTMRLQQQVVMSKSGENPLELHTESIRFEPDRDLVSTEASLLMRTRQSRIEADQGVFDLAARVYRLTGTRAVYYHGDS